MNPARFRIATVAGLCLALGCVTALAQGEASRGSGGLRCFNGYGYTLDSGEYRYTEHHEQHWSSGRVQTWDVDYIGRNGDIIATKHMDYSANATVPTYTLAIPGDGYREGIRHRGDTWIMFRKKSAKASEQTKSFEITSPMAADSGFNALVREHFDTLAGGASIAFKFVAAARLGVINLKASRTGTTRFEGKRAVVFTAKLDMFLINYFVDSLKLTYDPDSRKLLEYRGIGNMHNASGEVYPVRVTYASTMPAVARQHDAPAPGCGSVD